MATRPDLTAVPETALWTLWFRSLAARRGVLADPMAVQIVEKIDYPFEDRFGRLYPAHAQIQGMRVLTFDREVRHFLTAHPDGTVVALGEGLETQFWRVDNGSVRWLTVDLPESLALRARLLSASDRVRTFAGSATDPAWTDLVDPTRGVLITAQGLLMYLQPDEAHAVIALCARRFPGGRMVFDAVPPWMGGVVRRGSTNYQPPPLPWTLTPSQLGSLTRLDPAIADGQEVRPVRGRGVLGWLVPMLRYLPVVGRQRPFIASVHFRA
jgi:O-methyltransferase involved in polyketide biosynthesis